MRNSKSSQYLLQKRLCLILIILLCAIPFSMALESITGNFIIDDQKLSINKENTESQLGTYNKSKTNEKDDVSPITGFVILDSNPHYGFFKIIKIHQQSPFYTTIALYKWIFRMFRDELAPIN